MGNGDVDHPLAEEIISWGISNLDRRPFRQYVAPWIKIAARKMKRQVFNESQFYPAMEKYLAKNLINDYNRSGGYSITANKATRKYIGDRLGRYIIKRARNAWEKGARFKK